MIAETESVDILTTGISNLFLIFITMKDPAEMKVEELKSELKKRRISFDSKDKKANLHHRLVSILETEKAEKREVLVNDTIEKIDAIAGLDDDAGN